MRSFVWIMLTPWCFQTDGMKRTHAPGGAARPGNEVGFTLIETLVAMVLLSVSAVALIGAQLQANATVREVERADTAIRHLRSGLAIGNDIVGMTCGTALQSALMLTEPIDAQICVSVACERGVCTGAARWGAEPDQLIRTLQ